MNKWLQFIKFLKTLGVKICDMLPILQMISEKTDTPVDDIIVQILTILCDD